MTRKTRTFTPFFRLVVPVVSDQTPETALALARMLGGRVQLIGLVKIPAETNLTAGTAPARGLRKKLEGLRADFGLEGSNRVLVSHDPWHDLREFLAGEPPDLLILEWPQHTSELGLTLEDALKNPVCKVALARGPWPEKIGRLLAPVRGGPNAELALRLALALPRKELLALHILGPGETAAAEAPFRGLQHILPRLHEVAFSTEESPSPADTILEHARQADLLILGASADPSKVAVQGGAILEKMLKEAPSALVIMKGQRPFPVQWADQEAERASFQAISLLVDQWFAENTYHADEFDDLERLVQRKRDQNLTISLALPALNEEETVGQVIETIQDALVTEVPLLDEIVLMDSDSTDRTRAIAANLGVPVHIHQKVLPDLGARAGKGEALWKSLQMTHGDLLVWIDTDIVNIHPRFVYGVIGPLLINPRLQFVKGFYQRPLRQGEVIHSGGGGRVTELTARPLINLFYPELSGVIQPLSGEYGGRRTALEQLPFFSGYGVEIGLLIDVLEKYGLRAIAQGDLLERVHHNQSLEALSKMSFTILQAFFRKLERRYNRAFLEEVNKTMKLIRYADGSYYLDVEEVVERERCPMIDIPEYRQMHGIPESVKPGS
jgi:glucosyl-3-phosphoglycerate synthase